MAGVNGQPQYMAVREVIGTAIIPLSGSGTSEVDYAYMNGLNMTSAQGNSSTGALTLVSHTITAGPTNTGPVVIYDDGIAYALPFNVACTAPQRVWDKLLKSTDAFNPGPWTWS